MGNKPGGEADAASLPVGDTGAALVTDADYDVDPSIAPSSSSSSSSSFDVTARPEEPEAAPPHAAEGPFVQVLYGSQRNTAAGFAHKFAQRFAIKHSPLPVVVTAMDQFEPDHLVKCPYVVFITSTYTDGAPPDNAKHFCQWLEDAASDFRVQKGSLSPVRFTVFGVGSSDYGANFNAVGKKIRLWMRALGAKQLCRPGAADCSDSAELELTPQQAFERWAVSVLLPAVREANVKAEAAAAEKAAVAADRAAKLRSLQGERGGEGEEKAEEEEEEEAGEEEDDDDDVEEKEEDDEYEEVEVEEEVEETGEEETEVGDPAKTSKVVDLEDLGSALDSASSSTSSSAPASGEAPGKVRIRKVVRVVRVKKGESVTAGSVTDKPVREMLSARQRASLTKQGYKIIGSHSGVKLCRWTKAMLRGRGGCYKHTFYGITSYQCMEMTPSLACANKCVFCWRHHTNPVGTSWKWKVDPPAEVLAGALENHRKMIATMKGVPGVQPARFQEALRPRHCALSLVGEPIMYPHINEFLTMLHNEGISSFLVTNAQFPEQLETLTPVTQLYLSIDGFSPESLKRVDRPLNPDFWERYVRCMELLRTKAQRTVYRLTLVKGFNMAEVAEYARLVAIGVPTFIEIKGVTFCGTEGGVRMDNVPFHEEVRAWCLELCKHLDGRYELACEHRHSCCILIADKRMKGPDGTWHTWIDYPKFLALEQRFRATGESFTAVDYSAPTPPWAVFGAEEAGFNPGETRVRNKGKYSSARQSLAASQASGLESAESRAHDFDGEPGLEDGEPVPGEGPVSVSEEGEEGVACCGGGDEEGGACCSTSTSSSSSSSSSCCAAATSTSSSAPSSTPSSSTPSSCKQVSGEPCACKSSP